MYKFGEKSQSRLDTCHKDLQLIMNEVIKHYDISILEGHRTQEQQEDYFKRGLSKLDGVIKKSKHQSYPSMAVDIMPFKKGTNAFSGEVEDIMRFFYLAGLVKAITEELLEEGKITHNIRWGGDFNQNDIYYDTTFNDFPHFELIKE